MPFFHQVKKDLKRNLIKDRAIDVGDVAQHIIESIYTLPGLTDDAKNNLVSAFLGELKKLGFDPILPRGTHLGR